MLETIKPSNFILSCDSYKLTHFLELPISAEYSYSVIVPRKPSTYADKIVAMGQTLVAHRLSSVRVEQWMVDEAEIEANEQGYEFNRTGWEIIINEFNGKLPLAMYGVEEGRIVAPQTPIMGILNTDVRFAWLPAYVETWAQSIVWKMSTVASSARASRLIIKDAMELTGADMSMLDWKLQNFGDRGADSPEEAPVIAGIAHAALFNGSDCTRANSYIKALYNENAVFTSSVEATEHSVMCANSDAENKDDFGAARMAVNRLYAVVARTKRGIGIPLLSVVIDTYNSRRFVRDYMGGFFKSDILESGGVMVFRPDSGDPTVEPSLVAADIEATFGLAGETDTGYKILNRCTSVIQGDGLKVTTIASILKGWTDAGYSMDSFLVGMGGGVTHEGGRDDFSFSMKAVAFKDENGWRRLLKEPNTDIGKKSLSGVVSCTEDESGELIVTTRIPTDGENGLTVSRRGWRLWSINGERLWKQTFSEVRALARK